MIIIGISGASGSGKSLLASTIVKELGSDQVTVITEDSYYKDHSHLPENIRKKANFDHPDSFDHGLLISHLQALKEGKVIGVPIYDYSTHTRTSKVREVGSRLIVVLEGILIFTDSKLCELLDIKIFIDSPLDLCLARRIERDMVERKCSASYIATQYEKTVRPMFFEFIAPSKKHADLIIFEGGKNPSAMDFIKAKIEDLLKK